MFAAFGFKRFDVDVPKFAWSFHPCTCNVGTEREREREREREEVTGGQRLCSESIHNLYS
jgi:hypothetical protein